MEIKAKASLKFTPELNQLTKTKELRSGLSVVVQIKNTLWVTNDETLSIERLSIEGKDKGGNFSFSRHKQFPLGEYLSLPVPPTANANGKFEEADLEGLDYDDDYLWLVGSHSLKRNKAEPGESEKDNFKNLAEVSADGNRYLLARIPVQTDGDTPSLKSRINDGTKERTTAWLKGDAKGNELTERLNNDPHLKSFLNIPGKDNGFDIEGLAVSGKTCFLGLRGPVLRGWSVILELELDEVKKPKHTELTIKNIRKHFLDLGGLGIRDLCKQGNDLLILTGPTMVLDGPVSIFRWPKALLTKTKTFIFQDQLEKVRDIPFGKGKDHAEGMALFSPDNEATPNTVVIVYDSASNVRQIGKSSVMADIFEL